MTATPENIVEIVTFTLNPGASETDFTATNEPMIEFLKSQSGFMYRSLCKSNESENEWTDIVYWDSIEDAQRASKAFMESEFTAKMMQYINPESVKMNHLPIKWQYYPEMNDNNTASA